MTFPITAEQRAMAHALDLETRINHPLTAETLDRLAAFFAEKDHRPSPA